MRDYIDSAELNRLLSPEIKDDEFYAAIERIAREEDIRTVLDIGASSGQGSTEAFVNGLQKNPNQPTLFCIEVSRPRFRELQKHYAEEPFVKCYNVSSVALEQFSNAEKISSFYKNTPSTLNNFPLEKVLDWLRRDIEAINNSGVASDGIKQIKQENKIDFFDVVLIDGSEFTGIAEFTEVYGARFILLDDIKAFKNYENHQRLFTDENYVLVTQNTSLRNGYSIFKRIQD